MQIREYLEKNPLVTAPMAGITDKAFRLIAREFGAGLIYSEMISAKAVTYKNKRTYDLFDLKDEENPIAIQLFGSEPEVVAEAAAFIENTQKPYSIDINMGCPVPKVVKNMEGSALMRDPKLAATIVGRVKKAIRTPVSVKFRSGWDPQSLNYLDFAQRIEDAGADFIAVHPRTKTQMYSGKADWSVIAEIKRKLQIPVIASGDIYNLKDFQDVVSQTGCDGVMLARGILGNFHLIKEIRSFIANLPYEEPQAAERIALLEKHLDLLIKYKGETVAVKEIRKFFAWYTKSLPGAARLRTEVNGIKSADIFRGFLQKLIEDDYFDSGSYRKRDS